MKNEIVVKCTLCDSEYEINTTDPNFVFVKRIASHLKLCHLAYYENENINQDHLGNYYWDEDQFSSLKYVRLVEVNTN